MKTDPALCAKCAMTMHKAILTPYCDYDGGLENHTKLFCSNHSLHSTEL